MPEEIRVSQEFADDSGMQGHFNEQFHEVPFEEHEPSPRQPESKLDGLVTKVPNVLFDIPHNDDSDIAGGVSQREPHTFEEQKEFHDDDEQVSEENELHKMHMLQSLQALQYMKSVEVPPLESLADRAVYLPDFEHPTITKTIIFDMDETLIHCVDDIETESPQHIIDIHFEDDEIVPAGINIRPFAYECLKHA